MWLVRAPLQRLVGRESARGARWLAALDSEREEELVKALPGLDDEERDAVRTAVHEAWRRVAAISVRFDSALLRAMATTGPILGASLIAVAVAQPGGRETTRAFFSGLLAGLGAATVPWQVRRFGRWRSSGPAPSAAAPVPAMRRLRTASSSIVVYAAATAAISVCAALAAGLPWNVLVRWGGVGVLATFTAVLGLRLALHTATRLATRQQFSRPFDEVLPRQAELVRDMVELAPVWDRPDVARYLVQRLEKLARIAEDRQPWTGRAPLSDPAIRRELRRPNDDLARIIRAHKQAVAETKTRTDYDKVVESLTSGVLALASNDWDALFAHSPTAPRLQRLSSYAVANVLPAAVLAVAALVLPWVPPFRQSTLPTASIRVSLLAFAVLRLIPGPSVTDLIDKGLSRGFDASRRG